MWRFLPALPPHAAAPADAATASGCPNPRYEFWLQAPGGGWTIVQAYSTSSSWAWNTTGLAPGTYTQSVHVRDATSSASYDAYLSPPASYILSAGAPCTSVTETASPASPQAPGTSVKFTATATGCPNPTYEFWLLAPGAGWAVTQAYGTANAWTWSTTGLSAGTYTLNGTDYSVRDTYMPTGHLGEIQVGGAWKKTDEETCTKK